MSPPKPAWRERGPKLRAREIIAGQVISRSGGGGQLVRRRGLVGGVSSLFYERLGSDLTERKCCCGARDRWTLRRLERKWNC